MVDLMPLPWEANDDGPVAARLAGATALRIVDGRLSPGELLTEAALAQDFGSSRTPAREAMVQLQSWGLIRLKPKKGGIVTAVTAADRRDLLDLRATLEIRAVELIGADTSAKETLIADLHTLLGRQEEALAAADPLAFAAEDFACHLRVIRAGRNEVVAEVVRLLGPRFARLTYLALDDGRTDPVALRREHGALIEMIESDDIAGFAEAIRRHIAAAHFPAAGSRIGRDSTDAQ